MLEDWVIFHRFLSVLRFFFRKSFSALKDPIYVLYSFPKFFSWCSCRQKRSFQLIHSLRSSVGCGWSWWLKGLSFWRSNPGLFCLRFVWESCWGLFLQVILRVCCFILAKVWFSLFWRYRFAINFTNLFEFLSFLHALLQLSTISPTIHSNVWTSIRCIP